MPSQKKKRSISVERDVKITRSPTRRSRSLAQKSPCNVSIYKSSKFTNKRTGKEGKFDRSFWARFLWAWHCESGNKRYSDSMVQASGEFRKHKDWKGKPADFMSIEKVREIVKKAIRD